jgi:hypothetical protein
VLEEDLPVGADRVEGELLAVDELLDADLGHVPQQRQDVGQLLRRVDPVGVGGAGARDRLDDDGEPDLLGGLPHTGHAGGADVPRRADAGGVEHPLHLLLVTERHGLLDRHAGQPERLADARRQHHVRLPQALDPVDRDMPGQPAQRAQHGALVGEVDVLVVRERLACHLGQRMRRLVADPYDAGTHAGEPAGEVRHLGRVAGREHDDVHPDSLPGAHPASTSSTRIPCTTRRSASSTTAVSTSRTMT